MKTIRIFLYHVFGLKFYLKLISKVYITLIRMGFFKKKYAELHFLKKIIQKGYTCIDIGANLGYYAYFLCKYVGNVGKVYAIEPVPIFREVLFSNISYKYKNRFSVLPYALGEENKPITMGMPIVDGVIHHGMTHVLSSNEHSNVEKTFVVEMRRPDTLFNDLKQLHFIKCDVEGYEYHVFSVMTNILDKFKPIVQCELGAEDKQKTIQLFVQLGYDAYILSEGKLIKENTEKIITYPNDVYFIHPSCNFEVNKD